MAKKTLLQILQQKPKTETRKISDKEGYVPHKGETGTRAFLAKLPITVADNPTGNDERFSGSNVTTFDRKSNRYGHDNVNFNDIENTAQLKPANVPTVTYEEVEAAFNEFFNQVDLGVEEAFEIFCEANELDASQFVLESDQDPSEFSKPPAHAAAEASTTKQYKGGKVDGMEMQKIERKDVKKTQESGKYAVKESKSLRDIVPVDEATDGQLRDTDKTEDKAKRKKGVEKAVSRYTI